MSGIGLSESVRRQMIDHCLDAYPLEGCGLLAAAPAEPTDEAVEIKACLPVPNASASARIYTIDPRDLMKADRQADEQGLEIVGVFHSHTHTEAYPSPTDVAQAPIPDWHYVLVSFAGTEPVVRSYRILDGNITEEPVVVLSQDSPRS
jgi:[CysO sulfur-carrier protein]-S-L-cysteine hydrolase